MSENLTVRKVESVKAGTTRQEIPDGHLPGLYLIVQPKPSTVRSWAIRYRHHGRSRKHTLGAYPALDLVTARERARIALRAVAEGRDPAQEKAHSAGAELIEDMVPQFVRLHCQRYNRASSAAETERLLRKQVLPRWKGRTVQEITRRDVIALLDAIVDAGTPIAANRVFAAIRKFFNWALSRDIIAASPCVGVKLPTPERSRDRVLTDDELKDVWKAAETVGYPYGALVKMLVLTGQRRDECAKMRWNELDLRARQWMLPRARTKTNQAHIVPLSDAAVALLESLPRIKKNEKQDSEFVFTTNAIVPANGYAKGKQRLDKLLPTKMPDWRIHDLRRLVASGMARLGINLPAIEKVLNHRSGTFAGIVRVYQKHSFIPEMTIALETWGRFVTSLVDGEGSNVVPLARAS